MRGVGEVSLILLFKMNQDKTNTSILDLASGTLLLWIFRERYTLFSFMQKSSWNELVNTLKMSSRKIETQQPFLNNKIYFIMFKC